MAMSFARLVGYGAGFVAFVAARSLVQHLAHASQKPDSPLGRAMMTEMDRQGIRGLMMSRFKNTTTDGEARHLGMELSKRGVARLEPAELEARARLLLAVDARVGDSLCAKRFMGTLQPDEMLSYLAQLDSSELAS